MLKILSLLLNALLLISNINALFVKSILFVSLMKLLDKIGVIVKFGGTFVFVTISSTIVSI